MKNGLIRKMVLGGFLACATGFAPMQLSAQEKPITVKCTRDTPAFDVNQPNQQIGAFQADTVLQVDMTTTNAEKWLVIFTDPQGKEIRALCAKRDLQGLLPAAPAIKAPSGFGATPAVTTTNAPSGFGSAPAGTTTAAATNAAPVATASTTNAPSGFGGTPTVTTTPAASNAPPAIATSSPAPSSPPGDAGPLAKIQPSLFVDDNLFDDVTEEVAKRMGLPLEGSTRYMSCYRSYKCDYTIFDQKLSAVSLYGSPVQVTEVDFMFLNEGDFFGHVDEKDPKAMAEMKKQARPFKEAMRKQEEILLKNLTETLGKSTSDTLGMGKAKERVTRWTVGGTAILLSVQDDQYIAMRIWPKALADSRGLVQGITDEQLGQRCRSNVERRANGDVVVGQIPMINQGPKGYCVPATYERLLRYFGMTADMYTLAMLGGTGRGSGTVVANLNEAIGNIVQRQGRQIRGGIKLAPTDLRKWIDAGVPLIWSMYVIPDVEMLAASQTASRRDKDLAQWQKDVSQFKLGKKLKIDEETAHVRLIIGYNEKTQEVAYSDSWGPEHAERWMTMDAAKAVSTSEPLNAITR